MNRKEHKERREKIKELFTAEARRNAEFFKAKKRKEKEILNRKERKERREKIKDIHHGGAEKRGVFEKNREKKGGQK